MNMDYPSIYSVLLWFNASVFWSFSHTDFMYVLLDLCFKCFVLEGAKVNGIVLNFMLFSSLPCV